MKRFLVLIFNSISLFESNSGVFGGSSAFNSWKNLMILDYDLNLTSGEGLVVKKSLAEDKRIQSLLLCLKKRVLEKSMVHNDLTPCF